MQKPLDDRPPDALRAAGDHGAAPVQIDGVGHSTAVLAERARIKRRPLALFPARPLRGLSMLAFGASRRSPRRPGSQAAETATLTISSDILVQGYGAWKLRHALRWPRLWPFVLGGAPGVTIGVLVLRWADPANMRMAIAAFLVLYRYGRAAACRWRGAPTRVGFLGGLPVDAGFPASWW